AGAERGATLEPGEAVPSSQQRVLRGVLGVLEGSQHPVAVHLALSAVRLDQLSERVAVPRPCPGQQVGCHHPTLASRLSFSMSTSISTPTEPQTGRPMPAHSPRVLASVSVVADNANGGEPKWERS